LPAYGFCLRACGLTVAASLQYVIGCSLGLYKPILKPVFVIPSRTFLLSPVFS
jgi:hypothetical protein